MLSADTSEEVQRGEPDRSAEQAAEVGRIKVDALCQLVQPPRPCRLGFDPRNAIGNGRMNERLTTRRAVGAACTPHLPAAPLSTPAAPLAGVPGISGVRQDAEDGDQTAECAARGTTGEVQVGDGGDRLRRRGRADGCHVHAVSSGRDGIGPEEPTEHGDVSQRRELGPQGLGGDAAVGHCQPDASRERVPRTRPQHDHLAVPQPSLAAAREVATSPRPDDGDLDEVMGVRGDVGAQLVDPAEDRPPVEQRVLVQSLRHVVIVRVLAAIGLASGRDRPALWIHGENSIPGH